LSHSILQPSQILRSSFVGEDPELDLFVLHIMKGTVI